MPRSELLGRVPAEWHEHVYDDDTGRLTHTVVHREQRWTEDDYGWVLALAEEKADLCPCCGMPSELAHSEAHEFEWEATARECYAGRARAEVQEDVEEQKAFHYPAAVLYSIKRNPNLWGGGV